MQLTVRLTRIITTMASTQYVQCVNVSVSVNMSLNNKYT